MIGVAERSTPSRVPCRRLAEGACRCEGRRIRLRPALHEDAQALAAPEGEAGSGFLSCGYNQRCGRVKLGKLSSSGGGGASGARIARGGARRRVCGGCACSVGRRGAGGLQGWGARGARSAGQRQRLAQAAGRQGAGSLEEASTAKQLKELLVAHCPDTEAGLAIQGESEHDLLWDRLQLVVARVRGRREYFVTASSADGVWELLRLRVPPKMQTTEERVAHGRRQATYQDDEHGNFEPGMRVRWERWEPYLE
eukprot:6709372-Pyramimonas_sp.AAC.1